MVASYMDSRREVINPCTTCTFVNYEGFVVSVINYVEHVSVLYGDDIVRPFLVNGFVCDSIIF